MRLLQALRSVHGWLGVLIMPWIVVIGLTGFYLNHPGPFQALLASGDIDESQFPVAPAGLSVDEAYARAAASRLHPDLAIESVEWGEYHKQPAILVGVRGHEIIVAIANGYVFDKTRLRRLTFDAAGHLVHTKYYWGAMLKSLHETGWPGGALGTFFADAASLAMAVFGLSGLYLFLWPRLRRAALSPRAC